MIYILIGILLAALAIGGPIMSVMCGAAGIGFIFYLCFKLGPKLTLIAVPVAVCFFLCMWLDDFVLMYAKHILKYVLICLIVTAAFCKYYFEEGYKHIVIGVTAGFVAVTMAALAIWMYMPRQFPVSDKIASVEIQQMSEPVQAVYPGSEELDELLKTFDRVEMCGTFEELTDFKRLGNTYRLTLLKKNGKEIDTYYFISKYYMAKQVGKHLVFYRWSEDSRFPYAKLAAMYEYAVQLDE